MLDSSDSLGISRYLLAAAGDRGAFTSNPVNHMTHHDPNMNLLFGVLALQMDFIDRADLIAATSEWVLNKERSLGEVLVEKGALDDDDHALLTKLVSKHLEKHGNDPQQSLAAVESIDSLRTELESLKDAPLSQTLATLPTGKGSAPRGPSAQGSPTQGSPTQGPSTKGSTDGFFAGDATLADSQRSQTLVSGGGGYFPADQTMAGKASSGGESERYGVVRLHAQGGLGKVFVAQDQELKREVALKEIKMEYAFDSECRERFVREAEVTGQLEHPGIVPVYGMGKYTDGRPFYAMRFIHGDSLKEAIDRFHEKDFQGDEGARALEQRKLLRHFIDVCYAMEYAHSRGILHRDLKPANIMIGRYGETLVVDWGLSKYIDKDDKVTKVQETTIKPTSVGSSTPTVLGSVVGTPQFMSPEQAAGRHNEMGAAADVYSLGATLFALLTGKPPVPGDDVSEVLRRVQNGEARRTREVDPRVPLPLDAICAKAMAVSLEERYATASDVAGDLERWLADEPVSAYEESWRERLNRWGRRHRSWVLAGAASLLLIAVVSVAATITTQRSLKRETIAKQEADRAKDDSLARYKDARGYLDRWLTGASDALTYFPHMQNVRKDLLELAVADYERLAATTNADADLEFQRGQARLRVGDVQLMLQQTDKARESYREALAIFVSLAERTDGHGQTGPAIAGDTDRLIQIANTHTKLGVVHAAVAELKEAGAEYQAALRELDSVPEAQRQLEPYRDALASALFNRGELANASNEFAQAETFLRRSIAEFRKLSELNIDEPRYAKARASALNALGRLLNRQGRQADAIKVLKQGSSGLVQWLAENQDDVELFDAISSLLIEMASSHRDLGQSDKELAAIEDAVKNYAILNRTLPGIPRYVENLALSRTNAGMLLHEQWRNEEAEASLRKAIEQYQDLLDFYPTEIRYHLGAASCEQALARVIGDRGVEKSENEALLLLQSALGTFDVLAEQHAGISDIGFKAAVAHSHLARHLQRMGHAPEAMKEFADSIRRLNDLIKQHSLPSHRHALAHVHFRHGLLQLRMNDSEAAKKSLTAAGDLWSALVAESPSPEIQHDLARLLANCPLIELRDAPSATKLAAAAVEAAPANADYRHTLATAEYRGGELTKSEASVREAIKTRGSEHAGDAFLLAMILHAQKNADEAATEFARAVKLMEAAAPGNEDLRQLRAEAAELLQIEEPEAPN